MKIKNLEVGIKIGNKEKKFTNLILNAYLNLFADSVVDFKSKKLTHCAINITKNNFISEYSSTFNFDVLLEGSLQEVLIENTIINKYKYIEENTVANFSSLSNFNNRIIKEIAFGEYDYGTELFNIYAYLDLKNYNIIIQNEQPLIISRIDKIVSDMMFWSNSNKIKSPFHLTADGLHIIQGMNYERILPKLYSVGVGVLPYVFTQEFLAEELDIQREGVGGVVINKSFINVAENDLYPTPDLYPSPNLYPQKPTANLLIYKFKMFREHYEDPSEPPILEDTGLFYVQYKEINNFGVIEKLKINYERG